MPAAQFFPSAAITCGCQVQEDAVGSGYPGHDALAAVLSTESAYSPNGGAQDHIEEGAGTCEVTLASSRLSIAEVKAGVSPGWATADRQSGGAAGLGGVAGVLALVVGAETSAAGLTAA